MVAVLCVLAVTVGGELNCGGVTSVFVFVVKFTYLDIVGPFPSASAEPTLK
jgi:hypothetical protein